MKLLKILPNSKEDINRVVKSNISSLKALRTMINDNGWLNEEQFKIFEEMFENMYWIEDEIKSK